MPQATGLEEWHGLMMRLEALDSAESRVPHPMAL